MKVSDIFSYALSAIKLRKLRAGLTTLGVVIGIAAIVALLSITQGLQATISEQLQTGFATNTLIVSTGGGFGMGPTGMTTARSDFDLLVNYTQIIDEIENVHISTAVIQKSCYINSSEKEFMLTVVGVNFSKYANIYSGTFVAESGELPLNPKNEEVVVGKRVSDPWTSRSLGPTQARFRQKMKRILAKLRVF